MTEVKAEIETRIMGSLSILEDGIAGRYQKTDETVEEYLDYLEEKVTLFYTEIISLLGEFD